MTKRAAGILATGLLCLGLQVQALGDNSAWASAGPVQRLIYVFSPDQETHCQRARQLPHWVAAARDQIQLIGVARWPEGGTHGGSTGAGVPLDLQRELRFPVTRSAELAAAGLPAGLLADIPSGTDYALLLTSANAVAWAIPGDQLQRHLAHPALTTDIDESTWGKIKEMFQ
jgi:hypothetical protein